MGSSSSSRRRKSSGLILKFVVRESSNDGSAQAGESEASIVGRGAVAGWTEWSEGEDEWAHVDHANLQFYC